MRGTVLITGAGRGIGRATAVALARRGCPLLLVSRGAEALAETAALCRAHAPTRGVSIDLADAGCADALDEFLAGADVDIVVNNAGVGAWAPLHEMSVESWNLQLDTNLRGSFLVTRQTALHFRRRGRGLYVNVGSDASMTGKPERAAYNASKFGLVGLTACMRAEFKGTGIHTALVLAGSTDTYFRGMRPGDRPGALSADAVARGIVFIVEQYPTAAIAELTIFPLGSGLEGPRSLDRSF